METTNDINIKLLKFNELFTKRNKDLKEHKWFSFPNDLLLHPDFDEITGPELKWFIWIISICSKCNSDKIRLSVKHAIRKLDLDLSTLSSMIDKLADKQIEILTDEEMRENSTATAPRPEDDRATASTEQNNNRTEQNNYSISQKFDFDSFRSNQTLWPLISGMNRDLVQIWCNEFDFEWLSESLAKAVRWFIKKKNASLTDSSDVWAERFDGWLNKAKNPLKRQNQASEEAFYAGLDLQNSNSEVAGHD